jgi:hypothetical protein
MRKPPAQNERDGGQHGRRRHAGLEQKHHEERAAGIHRQGVNAVVQVQEIDRAVAQIGHADILGDAC